MSDGDFVFLMAVFDRPLPCGEDLVKRPERHFALDVAGEDALDRDGPVDFGIPRLAWCG
jgi:hypothetical protein